MFSRVRLHRRALYNWRRSPWRWSTTLRRSLLCPKSPLCSASLKTSSMSFASIDAEPPLPSWRCRRSSSIVACRCTLRRSSKRRGAVRLSVLRRSSSICWFISRVSPQVPTRLCRLPPSREYSCLFVVRLLEREVLSRKTLCRDETG